MQIQLKKEIKSILKDVCLSSTVHAIPNIAKTTRISLALMWITFLIVSTGLCAYMIARNVTSYLQYEVTTKIREKKN